MAKLSRPRHGSLQFWPRKRAEKIIPSVNWDSVKGEGILGFLGYKVGMATAIVKDTTDKSMTQNKKIFVPVTIVEMPGMKIFSVRFYKNGKVMKDVIVSTDKELRKKLSVPKEAKKFEVPADYDDIRIIVYSLAKQTSVKKAPDVIELAIGGDKAKKLEIVQSFLNKEIQLKDLNVKGLLDSRATTTGRGFSGTLPRFGLTLKSHKSEKGVRRPGSLAPWHPARVTFRTPQAGQMGNYSRVHYNLKVISSGSISEKNINIGTGFKNYGKIKSSYILIRGSIQGPPKRVVLLTNAMRPTKIQEKKKYEFMEIVK